MAMHEINLDRAERNICLNFVDELWMGDKPIKLKKLGHRIFYRMDESEED